MRILTHREKNQESGNTHFSFLDYRQRFLSSIDTASCLQNIMDRIHIRREGLFDRWTHDTYSVKFGESNCKCRVCSRPWAQTQQVLFDKINHNLLSGWQFKCLLLVPYTSNISEHHEHVQYRYLGHGRQRRESQDDARRGRIEEKLNGKWICCSWYRGGEQ